MTITPALEQKVNEIAALLELAQTEKSTDRKSALFALAAIKAENLAELLKKLAETFAPEF